MALSKDDRDWVGLIVKEAIGSALLQHYQACPQAASIGVLFEKSEEAGKQINGVAASLAHVADAIESDKRAAKARREGMSVGAKIGMAAAVACGGGAGVVTMVKVIAALAGQ